MEENLPGTEQGSENTNPPASNVSANRSGMKVDKMKTALNLEKRILKRLPILKKRHKTANGRHKKKPIFGQRTVILPGLWVILS